MILSILFSFAFYQLSVGEISRGMRGYESQVMSSPNGLSLSPQLDVQNMRQNQLAKTSSRVISELIFVNVAVLGCGWLLSYFLARKTLKPIEEAHNSQARFVSDASHELRTPLTAMKTELEVTLKDKNVTKEELKGILESNLEEVDKLSNLSQTLLKLSNGDNKAMSYSKFSLVEITKKLVAQYDKNSSRVEIKTNDDKAVVTASQSSIEELVTIFLDNALKYSPDDSIIKINIFKSKEKTSFAITNKGSGISEKDLPYIFDRFFRADNARSNGGNGLGLSLAKRIIEIHNGELSVTSAENAPTTFTFSLNN